MNKSRKPAALAALFLALAWAGSIQAADPLANSRNPLHQETLRRMNQEKQKQAVAEATAKAAANVTPDVREVGRTNYHVHVIKAWETQQFRRYGSTARPLPQWENLHAKVVRITKDGVILEKATYTTHTERSRNFDKLNRIGGSSGGRDSGLTSWTEVDFTGDGELILLGRYPAAKGLVAGQTIKALAMRAGTHELKQGVPIARFDYGRPVSEAELKAQTAR